MFQKLDFTILIIEGKILKIYENFIPAQFYLCPFLFVFFWKFQKHQYYYYFFLFLRGKIRYYTVPPESEQSHVSSKIVEEMAKEFDLESYMAMETDRLDGLQEVSGPISLLESATGMVDAQSMETDSNSIVSI